MPGGGPQILVVEDDPLIGFYMCDLLKELGYEPLGPAADAAQAQRLLAGHTPAAAILDVKGVGTDGGDLVADLRARCVAIVVCSGLRSEDLPDALADSAFVPKPIDEAALAAALARAAPR